MVNRAGHDLVKIWVAVVRKSVVNSLREFIRKTLKPVDYFAHDVRLVPHKLVVKGAGKKIPGVPADTPGSSRASTPSSCTTSSSHASHPESHHSSMVCWCVCVHVCVHLQPSHAPAHIDSTSRSEAQSTISSTTKKRQYRVWYITYHDVGAISNPHPNTRARAPLLPVNGQNGHMNPTVLNPKAGISKND